MRGWAVSMLLILGVGCGDSAEKTGAAGGAAGSGGALGSGGQGGAPPITTKSFFDPCGGKIVDSKTGAIDPVEYGRQARAWDLATIDCRLGPKFTDAYPGRNDARPTLDQPPEKDVPVPSSAHLDTCFR